MKVGNLRDAATSGGFWMAWLLLAAATLIPAPTASFCLAFLAVTCGVFPLALGSRRQRIGAVAVLILSILLAFSLVDKAQNDPWFKKHRTTQTHQTN
ncbi:MAG: hypothetical protein PHN92_11160 [Geobacter sp.]|nr:hypothetical protein [Geobacter sp.]